MKADEQRWGGSGAATLLAVPHWLLFFSIVFIRGPLVPWICAGGCNQKTDSPPRRQGAKNSRHWPVLFVSVSIGVHRWFQWPWLFLRWFVAKGYLAIGCHGHDKLQLRRVVSLEKLLERFFGQFQGAAIRSALFFFGGDLKHRDGLWGSGSPNE